MQTLNERDELTNELHNDYTDCMSIREMKVQFWNSLDRRLDVRMNTQSSEKPRKTTQTARSRELGKGDLRNPRICTKYVPRSSEAT